LRDEICAGLEKVEDEAEGLPGCEGLAPGRFVKTAWTRAEKDGTEGGGGVMALMTGRVFEKVGCHTSTVHGTFPPEYAKQIPGAEEDPRFWASGISFIAHPVNPNAPAAHMNTRLVVTSKGWFGGGGDLTPMLMRRRTQEDRDSRDFHAAMRSACEGEKSADYERFKTWCDEYFYLKHREEQRGIGGVFFDDFQELGFEGSLAMMRSVGDAFLAAYLPVVERRKDMAYGERERDFQLYRRGRYVEFNLVWDRGTHFGLQSGGRTESILMSMPPLAAWSYQRPVDAGSAEARLTTEFLVRRDWL
jgi:coproporphyrinogen III oxidase